MKRVQRRKLGPLLTYRHLQAGGRIEELLGSPAEAAPSSMYPAKSEDQLGLYHGTSGLAAADLEQQQVSLLGLWLHRGPGQEVPAISDEQLRFADPGVEFLLHSLLPAPA